MKKEITLSLNEDNIKFEISEGLTNSEALVMAVNLFEAIKESMEEQLPDANKVTLEKFISTVCHSLRENE